MTKKLKAYEAILDDGKDIYKIHVPGFSRKDVEATWAGNGEFVRIKPVPEMMPDAEKVAEAMKQCGFPDAPCDLVRRILTCYVARAESAVEDDDVE